MEFPKRKSNRLKGFDYSSNGLYFITVCTEKRKNLLCRIVGGGAFDAPKAELTYMGKVAEKYIFTSERIPNIKVDKYVIMPNHIHLLLAVENEFSGGTPRASSPTNAAIPHFVSAFKSLCHRELGEKIFQRSYHDHIVRDENDYLKIWEYIDGNPAKWQEDCFYSE